MAEHRHDEERSRDADVPEETDHAQPDNGASSDGDRSWTDQPASGVDPDEDRSVEAVVERQTRRPVRRAV